MSETYSALIVDEVSGDVSVSTQQLTTDDLPAGDVLIDVHYSSVNYKDGLASIRDGKIVSSYPLVPGIDLAGVVQQSNDERFSPGDEVIVTGYELGEIGRASCRERVKMTVIAGSSEYDEGWNAQ